LFLNPAIFHFESLNMFMFLEIDTFSFHFCMPTKMPLLTKPLCPLSCTSRPGPRSLACLCCACLLQPSSPRARAPTHKGGEMKTLASDRALAHLAPIVGWPSGTPPPRCPTMVEDGAELGTGDCRGCDGGGRERGRWTGLEGRPMLEEEKAKRRKRRQRITVTP
jgi:hypothetical protein